MKLCNRCGKESQIKSSKIIGSTNFITLSCNHTIIEKLEHHGQHEDCAQCSYFVNYNLDGTKKNSTNRNLVFENVIEAAPASKISHPPQAPLPQDKSQDKIETPFTKEQVEMIAGDLMKYHGIAGRFNFHFDERKVEAVGACKCQVTSDGIIIGSITINKRHATNDSRSEVIETILHEIAHAITPGAQHHVACYLQSNRW